MLWEILEDDLGAPRKGGQFILQAMQGEKSIPEVAQTWRTYRSFLAVRRMGARAGMRAGEKHGTGEQGNHSKKKDQDYSEN